jgi:hypothetical protein
MGQQTGHGGDIGVEVDCTARHRAFVERTSGARSDSRRQHGLPRRNINKSHEETFNEHLEKTSKNFKGDQEAARAHLNGDGTAPDTKSGRRGAESLKLRLERRLGNISGAEETAKTDVAGPPYKDHHHGHRWLQSSICHPLLAGQYESTIDALKATTV